MNNVRGIRLLVQICMLLLLVSCGTKQAAVSDVKHTSTQSADVKAIEAQRVRFLQKVNDNASYSKNLTAKLRFTIQTGSKDISVAGSLHMRKDDVIRIQLTPMGLVEAGRVEFTKDYVLLMDRIHREYIKADYNEVDFLRENGLNFYSLQALFWNQLFVPGGERVSESVLDDYDVDPTLDTSDLPVTLRKGNMTYQWTANKKSGLIQKANITYKSQQHGTTQLTWKYADFKPLGSKQFPCDMLINVVSAAIKKGKDMQVNLVLKNLNTDSNWEARTVVSDRYKQVSVEDVLNRIMGM